MLWCACCAVAAIPAATSAAEVVASKLPAAAGPAAEAAAAASDAAAQAARLLGEAPAVAGQSVEVAAKTLSTAAGEMEAAASAVQEIAQVSTSTYQYLPVSTLVGSSTWCPAWTVHVAPGGGEKGCLLSCGLQWACPAGWVHRDARLHGTSPLLCQVGVLPLLAYCAFKARLRSKAIAACLLPLTSPTTTLPPLAPAGRRSPSGAGCDCCLLPRCRRAHR